MSTPPRPDTAATPTRIGAIDVLRGFALLGILLVNAQLMAGPYAGLGGGSGASAVDQGAAWVVTALVATKFYLLFSFLFGYSFTLQQRSAERAAAAFAPRHLRRSAVLFFLGLAHAVLLYPGDILMPYAVLGLVLYAFRTAHPRTVLRVAAGLLGAVAVLLLAYGLLFISTTEPVRPEDLAAVASDTVATYRGGPRSVITANVRLLPHALAGNLLAAAELLAAFLTGLAAGRWRALADPDRHRARMKRIIRRGLPIGLVGGVFMAVCSYGPLDNRWFYIGRAAGVLTAPALTAAYACGLLLLVRTRAGRRIGDALAPAGRMSLTNYLTQSLVLALVFTGYGLGLYDRVGTAVVLAGCLVLYAAQLALSVLLLRHTRYGPVEFLLRGATRGRLPRTHGATADDSRRAEDAPAAPRPGGVPRGS
ncbi:DUF418 domain-containing protein [Streptomyces sp. NPDC019443]|uniref:DUF418 domain-containing protein n=1 Tax=Streptomyces sp. NPDC019443 TaxID=3365061 RepID=UPI00378C2B40